MDEEELIITTELDSGEAYPPESNDAYPPESSDAFPESSDTHENTQYPFDMTVQYPKEVDAISYSESESDYPSESDYHEIKKSMPKSHVNFSNSPSRSPVNSADAEDATKEIKSPDVLITDDSPRSLNNSSELIPITPTDDNSWYATRNQHIIIHAIADFIVFYAFFQFIRGKYEETQIKINETKQYITQLKRQYGFKL
jgi:hypothetical protein